MDQYRQVIMAIINLQRLNQAVPRFRQVASALQLHWRDLLPIVQQLEAANYVRRVNGKRQYRINKPDGYLAATVGAWKLFFEEGKKA